MVIIHLHLLRRNPPFGRVKVEFSPLGEAQLSWPDKQMRRQTQRIGSAWLSRVAINRAQQLPCATRLSDRRKVLRLGRRQRVTYIGRDVVLGAPDHDGVAKYLPGALLGAMELRAIRLEQSDLCV